MCDRLGAHWSEPLQKIQRNGVIMNQTLIQAIAQKVDYLKRCEGNPQYEKFTDVARATHDKLLGHLPSGSGIDAGTKLEWDSSKPNCIRFSCGYHHMNDAGYYDGWTHHMIIVTPTFAGFDLRITGRD